MLRRQVWGGAPANTPREIIDKLDEGISASLADPKINARIADLGATVVCAEN